MVMRLNFEDGKLRGELTPIDENLEEVQINNEKVLKKYYGINRKQTINLLISLKELFSQSVSEALYRSMLTEPTNPTIF